MQVFLRAKPVRSPSAALEINDQQHKAVFRIEKDAELGCAPMRAPSPTQPACLHPERQ